MAKLNYELKQKLIDIAGHCFWLWKKYYSFLESCGIKEEEYKRYEGMGKFDIMRNIIAELENKNDEERLMKMVKTLYGLKGLPDDNVPDPERSKKDLEELRAICGEDLIKKEVEQKEFIKRLEKKRKVAEVEKKYNENLEKLCKRFTELSSLADLQARGFEIEDLVYELFYINEIEYQKSYRAGSEQIDGFFNFENFHYLVEVKWTKGKVNQGELAILDKKIDKKIKSARGLFISVNGFGDNCVESFSGKEPRIVLADGEDLFLILNGRVLLKDALKSKIDNVAKRGDIFFRLKNLL